MEQLGDVQRWTEDPVKCLQAAEQLICAAASTTTTSSSSSVVLPDLLSQLQPSSSNGPCTSVWTAGAIAYRCKTCAVTSSSAICVACFKAGGHDKHDYIMYRSAAGGCCDCGDTSSWRAEGCCPAHSPLLPAALLPELPDSLVAVLQPLLRIVFMRVSMYMQDNMPQNLEAPAAAEAATHQSRVTRVQQAVTLLQWLQPLLKVSRIRSIACDILLLPEHQLAAAPTAADAHQQQQLWQVCQGLVNQLRPPDVSSVHKTKQSYLLQRLLLLLPRASPTPHDPAGLLITEVMTVLLLLIYDGQFRYHVAKHLLHCYEWLLGLVGCAGNEIISDALSGALDRLTVQLFNSEEATMKLLEQEKLLEELLTTAMSLTKEITCHMTPHHQGLEPTDRALAAAAMDVEDGYKHRFMYHVGAYRRVTSDMSTVLHHAAAGLHLLNHPLLLEDNLLTLMDEIQGLLPMTRIAYGDVADSTQQINASANLEIMLSITMHDMLENIVHKTPPGDQVVLQTLANAAAAAAAAALEWQWQQQYYKQQQQANAQQQDPMSAAYRSLSGIAASSGSNSSNPYAELVQMIQQLPAAATAAVAPPAAAAAAAAAAAGGGNDNEVAHGTTYSLFTFWPEGLLPGSKVILQLCNHMHARSEERSTGSLDQSGSDQSGSDHPGSDQSGSDHPGSDQSGSDHPGSDQAGSDHPGLDQSGSDQSGSDHPGSDHPGSDQSGSDHPGSDQAGSDHSGFQSPFDPEFWEAKLSGSIMMFLLSYANADSMLQAVMHCLVEGGFFQSALQRSTAAAAAAAAAGEYELNRIDIKAEYRLLLLTAVVKHDAVVLLTILEQQERQRQQIPQEASSASAAGAYAAITAAQLKALINLLQQQYQVKYAKLESSLQGMLPPAAAAAADNTQQQQQQQDVMICLEKADQVAAEVLSAVAAYQEATHQPAAAAAAANTPAAAAAATQSSIPRAAAETIAMAAVAAALRAPSASAANAPQQAAMQPLTAASSSSSGVSLPGTQHIWSDLLEGRLSASIHLPLQRMIAACAQAVCAHMAAAAAAANTPAAAAAEQQQQVLRQLWGLDWSKLVYPVLVEQAWLVQAVNHWWVRNGDDVITAVNMYYTYKEHLLLPDMLLLQCWLAAAAPAESVAMLLAAFGGLPLLQAAGLVSGSSSGSSALPVHSLLTALNDPQTRIGIEAALRLLLLLLRDRTTAGQTQRCRCRLLLLHWLAAADMTYTQLVDKLPTDLQNAPDIIEEVLSDLAVFRQPRLGAAGFYCLKREQWRNWDPHFLQYNKPSLQRAMTRAADLADYQSAWQLTPPTLQLPPLLQRLNNISSNSHVLKITCYILASAIMGQPWGLAAAGQQQQVDDATGEQQQQHGAVAAAAAAAGSSAFGDPWQLLRRLSSGRRRRRSSLPAQGNLITEDMVLSSLNLISLGLHNLKLAAGLRNHGDDVSTISQSVHNEKLTRQECKVLEQLLGSAGDATAAAASAPAAAGSSGDELPGLCSLLLQLSKGTVAPPAAATAATDTNASDAMQQAPGQNAPAAAGSSSGNSSSSNAFSNDVVQCAKALLPIAEEVRAMIQSLLHPEAAVAAAAAMDTETATEMEAAADSAPTAAAAAVNADSPHPDHRATSKARQEAALAQLRAQQAAFLATADMLDSEDEEDKETVITTSQQQEQQLVITQMQEDLEAQNQQAAAAAADSLHCRQQQQTAGGSSSSSHEHEVSVAVGHLLPVAGECVICHEHNDKRGALGWLAHIQVSGTLAHALQQTRPSWTNPLNPTPEDLLRSVLNPSSSSSGQDSEGTQFEPWRQHGFSAGVFDFFPGWSITCCGHMMHTSCYMLHSAQIQEQALSESVPPYAGAHLVLPDRNEMLCPLCRRLCNCQIPAVTLDLSLSNKLQLQQQQQQHEGMAAAAIGTMMEEIPTAANDSSSSSSGGSSSPKGLFRNQGIALPLMSFVNQCTRIRIQWMEVVNEGLLHMAESALLCLTNRPLLQRLQQQQQQQEGGVSQQQQQQQQIGQSPRLLSVQQQLDADYATFAAGSMHAASSLPSLLWSCIARGIAHWESLKRPLPPGSFLASSGTSSDPSGTSSDTAAAGGGTSSVSLSGTSHVTSGTADSTSVLEAAHWRSLNALLGLGVTDLGCRGPGVTNAQRGPLVTPADLQQQQSSFNALLHWLTGYGSSAAAAAAAASAAATMHPECINASAGLLPAVHWPAAEAAAAAHTAAAAAKMINQDLINQLDNLQPDAAGINITVTVATYINAPVGGQPALRVKINALPTAVSKWDVLIPPPAFPGSSSSSSSSSSSQDSPGPRTNPGSIMSSLSGLKSSWEKLVGLNDPWLLFIEVLGAGLTAAAVTSQRQQQQQQQQQQFKPASGGDNLAVWLQSPVQLLQRLLLLLAPVAAAQAAMWSLGQLPLLPDWLAAAVGPVVHFEIQSAAAAGSSQQQQQQQQQQRQVLLVVAALQTVAQHLAAAAAAAAAGTKSETQQLQECIAAQLLPYLHRVYLLRQLLLHRQPSADVMDSYARVAAPTGDGSSSSSSSSAGSILPSEQLIKLLLELGLPELPQLLLAALSVPAVQQAAAAAATAAVSGTAAAPQSVELPKLPAWLSSSNSLLQYAASRLAAAAAEPTAQQQQKQQQQHGLVARVLSRPCFMSMPDQYQELYLHISEMTCGLCGRKPKQPALCLVTGRFICSTADCPASLEAPGTAKNLVVRSGGSAGLLLLKSSRFAAERGFRLATCQSPFRDPHGEDWTTSHWGRPLRLKPEVYGMLSDMWAASGFDFDSYMLHNSVLMG